VTHRRLLRIIGAGAWLLAAAQGAAMQAPQLLPVDDAVRRPDFFSFRARLQVTVAERDVEGLMAIVAADIKNSFGGSDGADAFREAWRPAERDSRIWRELATVLALGGTFLDDNTFVAPYVFSRWPERYDSFEHVALVAANVRIRDAAREDAPVLTSLSFAVLALARTKAPDNDAWTAVTLPGGRTGFVASQFARSPIAYRAFFTRRDGRWQLVTFVAGD
jgi:hypothetical protein